MPRSDLTHAREQRIFDDVLVHAYCPEEWPVAWCRYLQEKLSFPFKARCVAARTTSPLREGEAVEVLGLAPEDDCFSEVVVLIRFAGCDLGVPLSQLAGVEAADEVREAVEDWRFWMADG
jgi:hypothetical protein